MTIFAWKRMCVGLVLAAAGFVVTTSGGAGDRAPADVTYDKDRMAELEQKIELLELRIEALERGSVEPALPRFVVPPLAAPAPPAAPRDAHPFFVQPQPDLSTPPNLPRGARRHEFNGIPYYIVPLENGNRSVE